LSTDYRNALAWLGFEEYKPGHLPEGQGVLVVQMLPVWTGQRFDVDREELLESVTREAGMPSASDASTRFKTMAEASRVMVEGIQAREEG
jgi:predicted NAD/FAD-dependent oxidoreductase